MHRMSGRGSRRAVLAGLVSTLALALPSCGGGDGSDEAGADMMIDREGATAQIERYRRPPRFEEPGPAFDARRSLRGKRIFEIPITSEVPFVTSVERGMEEAADAVGAELVVYRNQGEPSQWIQGMRAAIAQRADAITLLAQNPALLGPQIEQAEEAGIPVIVLRTTGERERCQTDRDGNVYGTTCIPGPFEQAGRLEADWAIAHSDGDPRILVITSSDARSTRPLLRGMKDEFERRCPGCKVRYVDVPIPRWAEEVGTEVRSALVRDPRIDYIIPIYDSMSQYVVPAIRSSRAAGRVKIATFNGTPFVLKMLQEDDVVEMDVGENLDWLGWASMDQAFRLIADERPVRSENTPLRVFDDTNVDETGTPPRFNAGYGDEYIEGYKRLWGVSP